jgi:3-isopropylmalate/(R)-2-methylmalate dehydratase large subunit
MPAIPPDGLLTLHFAPRVLFLSQSPDVVVRGLQGQAVKLDEAMPLRDAVSTDEITPLPILTHYDDTLGRYPYTGFRAGDAFPIGVDAIRAAGVEVVVAGKRYGKGSSREHSPTAEKLAGVRLVIAETFERLYRQNADNIGLFTSTDFGLVDRVRDLAAS